MNFKTKIIIVIAGLLLWSGSQACAQAKPKILLLPVNDSMIFFQSSVMKIATYNGISNDSLKKFVQKNSLNRFISNFDEFNVRTISDFANSQFSLNIAQDYKQWNSFKIKYSSDSYGNIIFNPENEPGSRHVYWGRIFTEEQKEVLKALIEKEKIDYIFCITKFEASTPFPFNWNTHFSVHVEIFNNQFQKIYGSKSFLEERLGKKVYMDVVWYLIINSLDEVYRKSSLFLKTQLKK